MQTKQSMLDSKHLLFEKLRRIKKRVFQQYEQNSSGSACEQKVSFSDFVYSCIKQRQSPNLFMNLIVSCYTILKWILIKNEVVKNKKEMKFYSIIVDYLQQLNIKECPLEGSETEVHFYCSNNEQVCIKKMNKMINRRAIAKICLSLYEKYIKFYHDNQRSLSREMSLDTYYLNMELNESNINKRQETFYLRKKPFKEKNIQYFINDQELKSDAALNTSQRLKAVEKVMSYFISVMNKNDSDLPQLSREESKKDMSDQYEIYRQIQLTKTLSSQSKNDDNINSVTNNTNSQQPVLENKQSKEVFYNQLDASQSKKQEEQQKQQQIQSNERQYGEERKINNTDSKQAVLENQQFNQEFSNQFYNHPLKIQKEQQQLQETQSKERLSGEVRQMNTRDSKQPEQENQQNKEKLSNQLDDRLKKLQEQQQLQTKESQSEEERQKYNTGSKQPEQQNQQSKEELSNQINDRLKKLQEQQKQKLPQYEERQPEQVRQINNRDQQQPVQENQQSKEELSNQLNDRLKKLEEQQKQKLPQFEQKLPQEVRQINIRDQQQPVQENQQSKEELSNQLNDRFKKLEEQQKQYQPQFEERKSGEERQSIIEERQSIIEERQKNNVGSKQPVQEVSNQLDDYRLKKREEYWKQQKQQQQQQSKENNYIYYLLFIIFLIVLCIIFRHTIKSTFLKYFK